MSCRHLVLDALAKAAAWAEPTLRDHVHDESRSLAVLLSDGLARSAVIQETAGGDRQARIGILMPNSANWLRASFATMGAGGMAVPLPLPAGFLGAEAYVDHILSIARTARLDAVVIDEAAATPTFRRIRQQAPDLKFIDIETCPTGTGDIPAARPEEPCVVQFTSGSTGRPKGVILTQANVVAALGILRDQLFLSPTDRLGNWLPLFHDMGLFMTLSAFAAGAGVDMWTPSEAVRRPLTWLAQFAAAKGTVIAAPNFFYETLATAAQDSPQPLELDLRTWRIALNGAETIRADGIRRFVLTFARYGFHPAAMWPVYGLAEATLPGTLQHPGRPYAIRHVHRDHLAMGHAVRQAEIADDSNRTVVGCGRQLSATSLRIADAEDRPLADGHVGEIQLRGPSITPGYLDLPRSAAPLTPDGWLKTGDLGFVDDGELFITGRLKNMASVNGYNVYAEDVEDVVRVALGGQVRCGAVAGVDPDGTETVRVIFETVAEGQERVDEESRVRVAVMRALGAVPVSIAAVPPRSIAHTSSGKVQRHQLPVRT